MNPEAKDAFNLPRKAVLTQSMATKVFGQGEAIGKILTIDEQAWEVVGLLEDYPGKSHLKLDLLLSIYPTQADSSLAQYLDSWQGLGMVGYALLNDAASEATVEELH